MKESNVKNKTYLTINWKDQTKKLIPILQQKWKYLTIWNKIPTQKRIVHKQLIGNKTNERKQCQKQNIFNNKLERSDQTANNNTSEEMKISQNVKWKYLKMWNENISKCEMKISQNVKQDTSSENSSQTVEIRNKTNERKQCQKQKIFNNKLERSDQKANTNFSADMKISPNVKQDTSWKRNSPQTVDIENKTNERKAMSKTKHM